MKIIKYSSYFGRMGTIEMVAVCTDDDLQKLYDAGEIYLGEVLGKHSEVSATVSPEDITVISDDPKDCEVVQRLFGKIVAGRDLWCYLEEQEEREQE